MTIRGFAAFHEEVLLDGVLASIPLAQRRVKLRRASMFFAEACGFARSNGAENSSALLHTVALLSERGMELAIETRDTKKELAENKAGETERVNNHQELKRSLKESDRLKEQLRLLSRRILTVQEEERKKVSRELHDVVAQALSGINFRLSAIKREASLNTRGLRKSISLTQNLVRRSTEIVHRFARELRPTVLDDLGLIPALHAYMKAFTTRTGVRAHLKSSQGVALLDAKQRTAFFRVAQEALTNVGRHARASCVDVTIRATAERVTLSIKDDGKSFSPERVLSSMRSGRLGLVGMRERIEMIGGEFQILSSPADGTRITAAIPLKSKPSKRAALPAKRK